MNPFLSQLLEPLHEQILARDRDSLCRGEAWEALVTKGSAFNTKQSISTWPPPEFYCIRAMASRPCCQSVGLNSKFYRYFFWPGVLGMVFSVSGQQLPHGGRLNRSQFAWEDARLLRTFLRQTRPRSVAAFYSSNPTSQNVIFQHFYLRIVANWRRSVHVPNVGNRWYLFILSLELALNISLVWRLGGSACATFRYRIIVARNVCWN
jgi:hypothetical protein